MNFDQPGRAIRPNEPLERKVEETNELLRAMLTEIKALRNELAPKQVGIAEARDIVARGEEG